jgi:hypothetical protein
MLLKPMDDSLQMEKILLEQFWDNSKYEQMSETGKKSYLEFQFLRCCGEKMLLINSESKEAVVNRTDYEIVSMDNLGLNNKTDSYEYKIQKLNHKYLLLQHALLTNPEGYEILSVRDVTSMFTELRQTAVWFLGIYLAVFCIAGLFIYLMMKRTVQQMEKLAGSSRKTGNAYGSTCPRNENTSYFYYWIFRHSAACKTKR